MIFLSETQSAELMTHELAYAAVHEALIAASSGETVSFPAILGHGSSPMNRFSIKSASTRDLAGLKVGSFWPGNADHHRPRHNSLILLFDQDTGRINTVIEAGAVNAFRTAATDAVAAEALSRRDAGVLAVFGAGHQAKYEVLALTRIRDIQRTLVVAREAEKGAAFIAGLAGCGCNAVLADPETACRQADIIVTATPSRTPLFDAEWVKPGTHIASMGSDAPGKQELPEALFRHASLFCDIVDQSVRLGEFQHLGKESPDSLAKITPIGDVLRGLHSGRQDQTEITIFDSSGLALQDLFIGRALISRAGLS